MKNDIIDKSVPYISLTIASIILMLGMMWLIQGNEFFLYKTFGPKMEAARRETFEESKAYNEGMAQELRRMQSEYIRAPKDQQGALASVILHQTAGYDENRLPQDLRDFIRQLRQGTK